MTFYLWKVLMHFNRCLELKLNENETMHNALGYMYGAVDITVRSFIQDKRNILYLCGCEDKQPLFFVKGLSLELQHNLHRNIGIAAMDNIKSRCIPDHHLQNMLEFWELCWSHARTCLAHGV